MTRFDDLKIEHQRLLSAHDSGGDQTALLAAVQEYIERIRLESEQVSDARDRDQLRSYLRFWGAYIYDHTGTYPETALRPALRAEPQRWQKWDWRWAAVGGLILLVIVMVLSLAGAQVGNIFSGINASLAHSATPTKRAPTEEPVAIETTETALLPTSSLSPVLPSSTPTPRLIATATPLKTEMAPSLQTATVAALLTQAAAEYATSEVPEVIPVQPTEEILIPVTGGGGFRRSLLSAEMSGNWCTSRYLEIGLDDPGLVFGELASLNFWIDPAGSRQPLRQEISVKDAGAVIDLSALIRFGTYALLHLEHPRLPSQDVIFRYGEDCRTERLGVVYRVVDEWLFLEEEPLRNQNLSLEWRLVTWGPEPDMGSGSNGWLAVLDLSGQGGDSAYIYWKTNDYGYLEIAETNQVLIRGEACEPGLAVVGVTSGGEALTREIILQAPYCP